MACFLRWQLLQSTDTILDLADHRIVDLWRAAHKHVEAAVSFTLASYQPVIATVIALADDPAVSDQTFRERGRAVAVPFADELGGNRRRRDLQGTEQSKRDRSMNVSLDLPAEHPLTRALPVLRAVYAAGGQALPAGTDNPFLKAWVPLILKSGSWGDRGKRPDGQIWPG